MDKIILKLTADIFKKSNYFKVEECPMSIAANRQLELAEGERAFEGVDFLGIENGKNTVRAYKHQSYTTKEYNLDYSQAKMCNFSSKETIREIELIPV